MIKLDHKIIDNIEAARSAADLAHYLQNAIELEHSTIPPYLTAIFSLKPGTNLEIGRLIRSIVMEEMLHMTISANILIAIGGKPKINTKHFIPDYPGPLPMNIGDLTVGIEAFSIAVTENTFMAIEEPEHPVPIQVMLAEKERYATIAQFYDAIEKKIRDLGPSIFKHTTAPPQVVSNKWFPADVLFPITSPESACKGIEIIKVQGEGTSEDPFQSPGDLAHYYKFAEIANGHKIVKTDTGYAYAGAPIPFDSNDVWPLRPNCKIADYKPYTQAATRIQQFAYNYANLLNALHHVFNGNPNGLDSAIGLMYDLRVLAAELMKTPDPNQEGTTVGPSFEYLQVQGGM